jgi:hypothetical protein
MMMMMMMTAALVVTSRGSRLIFYFLGLGVGTESQKMYTKFQFHLCELPPHQWQSSLFTPSAPASHDHRIAVPASLLLLDLHRI